MTKLEEIARAIGETIPGRTKSTLVTPFTLLAALAAVKAMREPSRDVLTAFVDADVSVQDAAERWACAIDAIIAEAEQEGE